jgi:malonyl-CoA O-methyltransferase
MTMTETPGALKRRDVQRRFDRVARQFDQADFVYRHAALGLFDRLSPMQIDATRVLDLGSATGRDHRMLAKRFRTALVIGLDSSLEMLRLARRRRRWFSRSAVVQADAENLPFADGSLDLVYANLLLPWIDDLPACFAEIARVLRKNGLFVFSTLGPDSFQELRLAWGDTLAATRVRRFPDMHDVGDRLVRSGLRDPVLDVDVLTLQYRDADRLFADLRRSGAGNTLQLRERALAGKTRFRSFRERLASSAMQQQLTVTLELVYGHAWGGGPSLAAGEVRFDAGNIGRRRR